MKYKGRDVRFKKCAYSISEVGGPVNVIGYAVDAGQIPKMAVHELSDGSGWMADDWDTGMRLFNWPAPTRALAVRAGFERLESVGEAGYYKAVAAAAKKGGLNARC